MGGDRAARGQALRQPTALYTKLDDELMAEKLEAVF